jgi:hypothetical protein
MKAIVIALALLAATAAYAGGHQYGPPLRYITHNGSLMSLEATPAGQVIIRYVQPRPSLWQWGVAPGTVLFSGRWINRDQLVGTAHVFGCGPIPYEVSGGVMPDQSLVLTGAAPIVAIWPFCGVVGWTNASDNAVLVFYPTHQ